MAPRDRGRDLHVMECHCGVTVADRSLKDAVARMRGHCTDRHGANSVGMRYRMANQ